MVPAETSSKQSKFSALFWLVILFEFFERGSYYGMMSFISVYFVDVLHFPKENVGVIKGVIQPLLYFLPILSGALADRFGYRKLLMIAFSLLGGGYFLTSQASSYGAVFAALVIMGFGAGIFKPLISGTIAKSTDEHNSTLGFGIYYWSINIGAFLFPLILVPFLKAMNPRYVIIASAICTAAMLIPTLLFYKDPVKLDKAKKRDQTNLIQTLANAFEIIYSPIVILFHQMKKSKIRFLIWGILLVILFGYAASKYINQLPATETFSRIGIQRGDTVLLLKVDRNMLGLKNYDFHMDSTSNRASLTIYKPSYISQYQEEILHSLMTLDGFEKSTAADLLGWIQISETKLVLSFENSDYTDSIYKIEQKKNNQFHLYMSKSHDFNLYKEQLLREIHVTPILSGITLKDCEALYESAQGRSFFMVYVFALILIGLIIIKLSYGKSGTGSGSSIKIYFIGTILIGALLWILPGLTLLGRIISSVIFLTITSLFSINKSDPLKFGDHAKFLLMIFLYSGFWIMYFQMFDSVLWYVQAYVDASSLNYSINQLLGKMGININWFFDVEHVTVINAGTIILLQLLISVIVKKTKALPTMMFGIALGTIGMAILAINTTIWIFIIGITIFSIGEMTAHPKFVSYIGLVAPKENKAMYMGYLFLYGVFGSSIGGIVGARLYVQFVDNLNQPRTLWLIFAGIGVATIIALALYNRFLKSHTDTRA